MAKQQLMSRITVSPHIFGGKAVMCGRRLAVEHVLGMLAAGDTPDTLLAASPWLESNDIRTCLLYAHKMVEQSTSTAFPSPHEVRLTKSLIPSPGVEDDQDHHP